MSYFNQAVNTPKGKATFIGVVIHNDVVIGAQVSRRVSVSEMTEEQRERARPSIRDMDRETLAAWLKSAKILVNEIYPLEEVTPCNN